MKKQRKRTSVSPVSQDTDATFVEKNGRTYYTSRNGKLRPNQWLFSFTMDIRDDVDGSRTGGLTGLIWLISLHDVPNTVIPVFISTRSWATKSALMSALFSERSMPTLSVQGDAGLYNLFLDWKYSQFKATNAGRKQSIACLGLQDDFRTVVLSPEVIYYIGEDGARRIQYPDSQYVWVPGCELPEKVVPYTGPEEPPFLLTLRRLLPKSTFYTFLFMLAHSLVGIKYCALITDLFGIPSVVVVGRPDSWKTTLANLTLSFFGRELHTLCNVRQISLPALRERWQKLRLPHIFHDVADIPTLREVILVSFEQQLHVNYRTVDEPAQPTSSVLITANAGNAEELVQSGTDRERLTSRIVFLQIDEPVTDWDFSDAQAFQRGKAFAATYAELLLGLLSPDSLNGFLATVHATQKTLVPVIRSLGVDTGVERTARMWSILFTVATEVVRALGHLNEFADGLNECLASQMAFSARYQGQDSHTALGRPSVGLPVVDDATLAKWTTDLVELVTILRRELPTEVATIFRSTFTCQSTDCLAFSRSNLPVLGEKVHRQDLVESAMQLEGAGGMPITYSVKFDLTKATGTYQQHRAILVPRSPFSNEQLQSLDGIRSDINKENEV